MRKFFILAAVMAVIAGPSQTLFAQTSAWPQFRGPNGNGIINDSSHPDKWDDNRQAN